MERKHAEQKSREEYSTLARLKAALDARLAALDAELAAIDRRQQEISDRRERIGEQLEALDEIERLRKSGKLDPNNPAHARLLKLAGVTDEEARSGDLAAIILRHRGDLDREDNGLETEWNANLKHRDKVSRERNDVAAARSEIENAHTPEAQALAERRATSVLGAQQLGEAASQTNDANAKIVAANAVGGSVESEDFNRRSTTDTDAFFAKSDDLDWSKPSAPPKPA